MSLLPSKASMTKIGGSSPVAIVAYLAIIYLIWRTALTGSEAMGYNWQWYRVPQYLYEHADGVFLPGELLLGLWNTVTLSTLAFAIAIAMGLGVAALRLSGLVVGSGVAKLFLEVVRNTPILILLYLFYYIIGPIFGLDRYWAAVCCLATYHSALVSEVFRAGIGSVPRGQWEAARSIGMSNAMAFRTIIAPQAVRITVPPLTGEAINLVKSSAIVSVIAVAELTTRGRNVISETYMSFEIWFTVAAIYMLLTLLLSVCAGMLERRFS